MKELRDSLSIKDLNSSSLEDSVQNLGEEHHHGQW